MKKIWYLVSLNGQGEHDRALWRPSQDKIQVAPESLEEMFRQVRPKTDEEYPLFLQSSHSRDNKVDVPVIEAHPDCGYNDGSTVTLSTRFGAISGTLQHNEHVHPSAILCSSTDNASVLDHCQRNPIYGLTRI